MVHENFYWTKWFLTYWDSRNDYFIPYSLWLEVQVTYLNLHARSLLSLCLFPLCQRNKLLHKTLMTEIIFQWTPVHRRHCEAWESFLRGKSKSAILFKQLSGARVHTKQTYVLLPFQYKQAKPDDQFIFSSSWLPSPRLELRTLAGYTRNLDPPTLRGSQCIFDLVNVYRRGFNSVFVPGAWSFSATAL